MAAGPKARPPHEVAALTPAAELRAALVRNLAEAVTGQVTYQAAEPGRPPMTFPSGVPALPTVTHPVPGGGWLTITMPGPADDQRWELIRQTAAWLATAERAARLTASRDRAAVRVRALRTEATVARDRFARVRELERARLSRLLTVTTTRDLDRVRDRLRGLADRFADDPGAADFADPGTAHEVTEVQAAMDDLLAEFRAVARGVYPVILPERGLRAALEELAATLPRPVRFTGSLGRRPAWQTESGLYHAVAAALALLADPVPEQRSSAAVLVEFDHTDTVGVRITAPECTLSATGLRAALDDDAERLAVFGGSLTGVVTDGVAVVEVRLTTSTVPVVTAETSAPAERHSELYDQVRALLDEARSHPDRRWEFAARRLTQPARLAVVRGPLNAVPATMVLPDVTLVPVLGPADEALAEEFLADEGPRGSIDGVLCQVEPTPGFRAALRRGRHRVVLSESGGVEDLARLLAERGPVIAARRAMATAKGLVTDLAEDHPLRRALDRVTAGAHEIAELDLLDDLTDRGTGRLLRGATPDAARLLGAHGTDPRTRLGLGPDAPDDEVRDTARLCVTRWRALAEHPGATAKDRAACEVLVRTAEGILSAAAPDH